MRKRITAVWMAVMMFAACAAGCGNGGAQEEADAVADLIDAIYVQERTEETDAQCAAAKAAWDALTDEQKALVEGENADPDYFGRDTGDASKDDPRNQDGIGENEILVVSFGTSFNDSRVADIKGIEDAIQEANPDWSVRRAFTAQIIINHIQARDGEFIDNMDQALARAAADGVKNLVVQPTHLMHGAEYDELIEAVEACRDQFETVRIAEPLLGEVGTDATVINADKEAAAKAITDVAVKDAGYDTLDAAREDGAAFVFLGHGTFHTAKVSYSQMQTQMEELGYDNVFIGTVEGDPEETACEAVMDAVVQAGYKKVILRPFMVVAGDHANNDMAGEDEDSWLSMFQSSGKFDSVDVQISGMGSIPAIQEIYVRHTKDALDMDVEAGGEQETGTLPDSTYTAEFTTDSSMFHVSEVCEGKGTLTVKNGEMTIHISLGSKNILNLYPGLAADAVKDGAKLLAPTTDTVTYSDGLTEEVYGFDVPVPAVGTEFDLALIGTKGKWYDHKVKVSNPVPADGSVRREEKGVPEDGTYRMEITFEGGTGKAKILSPVTVVVADGKATATVEWNSPNYDYMLVDGKKYLPVNTEGDSVFEIPVAAFDEPITVVGDTVAMSRPHEITYTITFHADSAFRCQDSLKLQYAENFTVDYYEGGYTLLTTTMDGARFLIVPEGREIPEDPDAVVDKEGVGKEVVVLKQPVTNIYLAASAAMDCFDALDGLDAIAFSSQKEESWYIRGAKQAMADGRIVYAGKYSKPDYERIVSGSCSLAIENMMISHSPEVAEKLEDFRIPVMIEYSSYESHPLGRVEWVKFYGALLGKEKEAERIFEEQTAILKRVGRQKKTDKTVAFFFITSNGLAQVRRPSDYVPKMIELAGGNYIFNDLGGPETKGSTVNMPLEEFYAGAKDADFLIYNSSIDGGVADLDALLDKCGLLSDFKAVKEGNVWCTTNDMYQQSLSTGYLIEDIHEMLQGKREGMHYLFHLN